MAIQIIEQTTPYGKLAENFGRNLGESMGQEAGRQIGVRGLEDLTSKIKSGELTDQLDIFTALNRIPGMPQEQKVAALPYLQTAVRENTIRRQAEEERLRNLQGQPTAQPGNVPQGSIPAEQLTPGAEQPTQIQAQPQAQPVAQQQKVGQKRDFDTLPMTLVSEEGQKALTQKQINMTPDQIFRAAYELQQKNPGLYKDINQSAEAVVRQNEAYNKNLLQEQGVATAQQGLTNQLFTSLDSAIQNKLQTKDLAKTWNQVPGTILDRFKQIAVEKVNNGESIGNVVSDVSKQALDFVKTQNDLLNESITPIAGRAGKKQVEDYSRYRKEYEKIGSPEEFKNTLMRQGFKEHLASTIAFPPNPKLAKTLSSIQDVSSFGKKAAELEKNIIPTQKNIDKLNKINEKITSQADKFIPKIIRQISPDDSIDAIALLLNDLGYDENKFFDSLDQAQYEGDFKPTPRQQRELNKKLPVEVGLKDLFISLNPMGARGKYNFFEVVDRLTGRR